MTSSALLSGNLRMRVDRDAAAIVAHRDPVVGAELELDARRVAGHRLVHRIVEHLGDEMVQRALVGAADIHAGPAAHRLQPFQDLDVLGGVAVAAALAGEVQQVRHTLGSVFLGKAATVACAAGAARRTAALMLASDEPRQAMWRLHANKASTAVRRARACVARQCVVNHASDKLSGEEADPCHPSRGGEAPVIEPQPPGAAGGESERAGAAAARAAAGDPGRARRAGA